MGPPFTLELRQQRYLSTSDTMMDAILRVTAGELGGVEPGVAAEAILLDCSGSMNGEVGGTPAATKIAAARRAAAAAIDALRAGTYFAVVQGTDVAQMCYPPTPEMVPADETTRAEAKRRINEMVASGGTAMGTWLGLARELFASAPAAIRHAVLLTDGYNQHETPEQLDAVLAACDGRFTCDARGIGIDWDPVQLRRIVGTLRGASDAIRADEQLVDDFRALAAAAMRKVVGDLRIRVTTAPGVALTAVKQVHPRETDYTANPARRAGPVWEFGTGSWAALDSRDYQLTVRVERDDRDPVGEDLNVAFVELVAPELEDLEANASVLVHWTRDPMLSSRFDPTVAHYKGQGQLTKAILDGFAAFNAGRLEEAVRHWGHAVRLATESANQEALLRLGRLVEFVDAANGIVRLKPHIRAEDMLSAASGADISSSSDQRRQTEAEAEANRAAAKPITAPCGHTVPSTAKFCPKDGRRVTSS